MKNILQAIKLFLFIGVVFGTIQLQAQEKHFIYIQNETKQPFYVKLNKEVYSSTPGGYLIIPQLVVGKYNLATGFAKNEIPEQKFLVDLNSDAGFSLKQSGDKEWELFDLQSFKSIVADNKDTATVQSVVGNKETPIAEPSKKDSSKVNDSATSISTGNSAIVNSSSPNEIKKDSVTTVVGGKENSTSEVKKDTVTADIPLKENSINEIKRDSVTTVVPQKEITHVAEEVKVTSGNTRRTVRSSIVKTFAKSGIRGLDLIYIDKSGSKRDTIALFIPHNEKTTKVQPIVLAPENNLKSESNSGAVRCSVQATDEDFYKTRMHIASATTESSMILAAKAAFRTKCFSTKQVKYLDVLFLSEESRLRFLEIAKPYVYDPRNFSSLQSQFTEPIMIQRFRALLKKK